MRLYAVPIMDFLIHKDLPAVNHATTIAQAPAQNSLLLIAEIFLLLDAIVVNKSVIFGSDLFSGCKACARFRLVDSRHGGLGSGGLWILLLSYGVASVDPVEVYVHRLCEI